MCNVYVYGSVYAYVHVHICIHVYTLSHGFLMRLVRAYTRNPTHKPIYQVPIVGCRGNRELFECISDSATRALFFFSMCFELFSTCALAEDALKQALPNIVIPYINSPFLSPTCANMHCFFDHNKISARRSRTRRACVGCEAKAPTQGG